MLTQDSSVPIRVPVFHTPTDLPEDPATLQLILRAALAEIERLQLLIAGLQRNLEQSVAEQMARLRRRRRPG